MSLMIEFARFLIARKNYWLWPIVIASALVGGLVVLTHGSAVAPFIYAVF